MSNSDGSKVQPPGFSNKVLTAALNLVTRSICSVSGRNIFFSPSYRPTKRTSSISFLTAQPWTPTSLPTSANITGVRPAPPPVGGLTDTLLQDFEERRAQQKLEENSVRRQHKTLCRSFWLVLKVIFPLQYAGILRLDHINQAVNVLFPSHIHIKGQQNRSQPFSPSWSQNGGHERGGAACRGRCNRASNSVTVLRCVR